MKILFIGEAWLGSCARSLREALARTGSIELDDFDEQAPFPKSECRWLRAINRVLLPAYELDFDRQVLARARALQPDVVMTYKGVHLHQPLIGRLRKLGILTVNVYPDCSPHAHGGRHRRAVGAYDLVISTKAYHPELWRSLYGYDNRCDFVPQGYDPSLHLVRDPPSDFRFDVAMIATYRAEYGKLIIDFSHALNDARVSVAIGGYGWDAVRAQLPPHWTFLGAVSGWNYVSILRGAKICIAPLTREVVVNGCMQPGDIDTTRSYELAAAHCFFFHRRTDYAKILYDEATEVPMFDSARELADLTVHYLARDVERMRMSDAAHRRAVPAYSLDARAKEIIEILQAELA